MLFILKLGEPLQQEEKPSWTFALNSKQTLLWFLKFCFGFQCDYALFHQDCKWVPKYKWCFQGQPQISQANLLLCQGVWSFLDLTVETIIFFNSSCSVQLAQSTYPARLARHFCMEQDTGYWTDKHSGGSVCRWLLADEILKQQVQCSCSSSKGIGIFQLRPLPC